MPDEIDALIEEGLKEFRDQWGRNFWYADVREIVRAVAHAAIVHRRDRGCRAIGVLLDAWEGLPNDVKLDPDLASVETAMDRLFVGAEGGWFDSGRADLARELLDYWETTRKRDPVLVIDKLREIAEEE